MASTSASKQCCHIKADGAQCKAYVCAKGDGLHCISHILTAPAGKTAKAPAASASASHAAPATKAQCNALTQKGARCSNTTDHASGKCYRHQATISPPAPAPAAAAPAGGTQCKHLKDDGQQCRSYVCASGGSMYCSSHMRSLEMGLRTDVGLRKSMMAATVSKAVAVPKTATIPKTATVHKTVMCSSSTKTGSRCSNMTSDASGVCHVHRKQATKAA